MRTKIVAALLAVAVPLVSSAATSIPIDARNNCITAVFGRAPGGTPARFQLTPGRYVISLVSNNMSCAGGGLGGGCLIDTVFMQGGWGTAHWGTNATAHPSVIDVTNTTTDMYAYVSDDICSDNAGGATLLIQPAN
ncbi:hypothetical protein Bsp3421_006126 [Burkholderia sp. FERM BP-3421]|jgi:hypothetical protein|uniref:hypothetical protein n=1 Tax=Burkholderia sp. FERM BP-3421 TaxID=1494466 RepID=UPI002360F703|nr:hypothetical protein [Burkholderia sp. FERM BP-3421]WDD95943.1 hypothetical protein Bsp3421_006126 [Burkholderia sp. FERM BP-3421]